VNLLLVERGELADDGTCVLDERRSLHLRQVLGVQVGSKIRAGLIGGGHGQAEVLSDDGTRVTIRLAVLTKTPPGLGLDVILAIPRPKALSRVIETLAAFSVRRIDLTNAWRVDKSYLRSPRLAPDALAASARLGAEQGATTLFPEIHVHERLMSLLDGRYPAPAPGEVRLLAHPGAPPIETAVRGALPASIAIGPEGGWIERELETFVARGFTPVSLGGPVLRVENAVAALLAQLLLLARL
jgi:16S rRNA (uracil1498-N3)-methyltransferase